MVLTPPSKMKRYHGYNRCFLRRKDAAYARHPRTISSGPLLWRPQPLHLLVAGINESPPCLLLLAAACVCLRVACRPLLLSLEFVRIISERGVRFRKEVQLLKAEEEAKRKMEGADARRKEHRRGIVRKANDANSKVC